MRKIVFIFLAVFLVPVFLLSCSDGLKGSLDSGSTQASESSSGNGENNSSKTYTSVAGGTYINLLTNVGFAFNEDYSVNVIANSNSIKQNGSKWRIVNDYTVQIYVDGIKLVSNTFIANSSFTKLMDNSIGPVGNVAEYIRQ